MQCQLPVPKPYLEEDVKPPRTFVTFIREVKEYFELTSFSAPNENKKKKVFLSYCLGLEGRRRARGIIEEQSDNDQITFDVYTKNLENIFDDVRGRTIDRVKFNQRVQGEFETAEQFLAELSALSKECAFDTKRDELIVDRLIVGCKEKRLRERLLRASLESSSESLSLAKCRTIIQSFQLTEMTGREIETRATSQHNVDMVRGGNRRGNGRRSGSRGRGGTARGRGPIICFNCQQPGHKSYECPHPNPNRGSARRGGNRGNGRGFAQEGSVGNGGNQPAPSNQNAAQQHVVETFLVDEDLVNEGNKVTATLMNDEFQGVKFTVDTGAQISCIERKEAERLGLPIQRSQTVLKAYGGNEIESFGEVPKAGLWFRDKRFETKLIVTNGPNLLGINEIRAFEIDLKEIFQFRRANQEKPDEEQPVDFEVEVFKGLGYTKNYQHRMKLKVNAVPLQHAMRPIPVHLMPAYLKELKRMEETGVIEPTENAEWINPMRIVIKNPEEMEKGGEPDIRPTLDLRYLNGQLVIHRHPMPNIEILLSRLAGAKVFSKLDLSKAFWQVPLAEDCRDLTAFMTPNGLRRFTRMVMGSASSGPALQGIVESVLAGCEDQVRGMVILIYSDDMFLAAQTEEDLRELTRIVLKKLYDAGFRLGRDKCLFMQSELIYLGHRITKDGIAPSPENVEAIQNAAAPEDAKQLRSLLGMATYYHRFVPRFSEIVRPLHDIVNASTFVWTDEAERSFKEMKEALVETAQRNLRYFVPGGDTVVTTDASASSLSGILSQKINGVEVPVSFFSRRLHDRELKFGVGEKEALALIESCERFHLYLTWCRFTVKVDHKALVTILSPQTIPRVTMRIGRWAMRLLNYCFDIEYIPSADNPADAISRLPNSSWELRQTLDLEQPDELVVATAELRSDATPAEVYEACRRTTEFDEIKKWTVQGWPHPARVPKNYRVYEQMKEELYLDDQGCLRRGELGVLIIPEGVRKAVLAKAHVGHPGIIRMKNQLRLWAWWPGANDDVRECLRACTRCAIADKTHQSLPPQADRSLPLPDGPWKIVAIDVMGPIETTAENRYLITLQDEYSKWPEIGSVKRSPSTRDVIQFLRPIFNRMGVPEVMKTDGGSIFNSAEFKTFLREAGSQHHVTTPYNSRSNSIVERLNGTVLSTLKMYAEQPAQATKAIEEMLCAYRSTPHTTTGESPAKLMFNREIRTSLSASVQSNPGGVGTVSDPRVRERVEKARGRQNPKGVARTFRIGDLVMMKCLKPVAKGRSTWDGPYEVKVDYGHGSYNVNGRKISGRKLRPYHGLAIAHDDDGWEDPGSDMEDNDDDDPAQRVDDAATILPPVQPPVQNHHPFPVPHLPPEPVPVRRSERVREPNRRLADYELQ